MLDYAYSGKLKSVEAAAKAGDYTKAGVELLTYFQNRYTDPKAKPRGWNQARVELWKDNIFGFDQQIHLLSVFDIKVEPENYSIDIASSIIKQIGRASCRERV